MPLEQYLHQRNPLTLCEHLVNQESHLEVWTEQAVAQTRDHATCLPELSREQQVTMWKTGHSSTYLRVFNDSERATLCSYDESFANSTSDGGTRPVTI